MKKYLFFFTTIVGSAFSTNAQIKYTDKLPFDTKVTTGVLPNGLTYFIQPNAKPEKKVELRLVIKAGSVDEDDDQQGLAHMAEHMAFNGTKNFKKNDIVAFLADIGVGFGNDLNANTYFDRTYYILPIPTDKPANLEKGFQVIEDWAHQVTYYDDDINGERNIILEESRLGKGANDRMQRKTLPKILAGSKYADRLPIGLDSIIKNFPVDAIKRFYRDWYRPNLMAVIVTGDITAEKAKQMIEKHFTGLTNPKVQKQRVVPTQPPYKTDDAIVVTDKEATGYSAQIYFSPFKIGDQVTFGDVKNNLQKNIFTQILNQRMQELTQKANPPFLGAGCYFGAIVKGYDQFIVGINTGTNNPQLGVKAAMEEVERAKKFGITAAELDRTKKRLLKNFESEYNERTKRESVDIADELFAYFNDNEPYLDAEVKFKAMQQIIADITIDDVNSVANIIKGEQNQLAVLSGPEPKNGEKLVNEKELLATVVAAENEKLQPYEEKVVSTNLLTTAPKPGKIIKTVYNKLLGANEYTLSNGVTVTVKKTDFENDQILLDANRLGGTGGYSLADKYSAANAVTIAETMGFGNFSPTDMRKALAGKKANVSGQITATTDGFNGNSSVADFETMLQMLYLKATEPRMDTGLFKSFIQKNKSQFAMLKGNPQVVFFDTLIKTMFNNNPMADNPIPNAENYDKISLAKAMAIYKERIGDANGMQFAIVGNVNESTIKPLIEKYIGSLPATKRQFTLIDNKVRMAKGNKTINVYQGKEEKSMVMSVIGGEVPYSEDLDLKAGALTEALNIQIIEDLREKVQGIYGGGIFGGLNKYPYPNYSFTAQLPCGPEKADTLKQELFRLIEVAKTKGIPNSYLDKVKKQRIEKYRESLKQNDTWIKLIGDSKVEGKDVNRFLNYEKIVNALTPKDLQTAAKMLLNNQNVLVANLMPKRYEDGEKETEKRANVVAQTINVADPFIKLTFYDDGVEDGDSITVYLNGKKILTEKRLSVEPTILNIKATKGMNEIVMYANNLGTLPPNTALLKVTADKKNYEIKLTSTETTNGVLRINY